MATRVDYRDCSKQALEGIAKSLARTIDAGETHNADGIPLHDLLEEAMKCLKVAPDYHIEKRRRA